MARTVYSDHFRFLQSLLVSLGLFMGMLVTLPSQGRVSAADFVATKVSDDYSYYYGIAPIVTSHPISGEMLISWFNPDWKN